MTSSREEGKILLEEVKIISREIFNSLKRLDSNSKSESKFKFKLKFLIFDFKQKS